MIKYYKSLLNVSLILRFWADYISGSELVSTALLACPVLTPIATFVLYASAPRALILVMSSAAPTPAFILSDSTIGELSLVISVIAPATTLVFW